MLKVDIAIITEHWLKELEMKSFKITDFKFEFCRTVKVYRELMILFKENLEIETTEKFLIEIAGV